MSSQAPAVAAQSDSPLLPEAIRPRKETASAAAAAAAAARALGHAAAAKPPGSRRGSTASWLHPLSSAEMPNSDVPRTPLLSGNVHATGNSDYPSASKAPAAAASAEPFPLQGFEVEAHRARVAGGTTGGSSKSDGHSGRSYTKLTGLLTRRTKEVKSPKSGTASNRSTSQLDNSRSTLQPTTMPEARTPSSAPATVATTTKKTPATTASAVAALNPLQRSGAAERTTPPTTMTDSVEVDEAGELRLDEGGYQWPAPPSPSTAAGSHGRASVSRSGAVTAGSSAPRSSIAASGHQSRTRRELSVSPLMLRTSQHATLRREGTSTPSAVHNASPGLNTSVAQFVPLGSADLGDGPASPTHLQRSYNFSGVEEDKSTPSVSQRNRSHRPRLVSANSLSASTSQSLGLGGSTRFSQTIVSRQLGDTDTSTPASLTARSLRDAKAALLRRAQPSSNTNGNGSRVSRQPSCPRSQSNASLSIAEPTPPSRSWRVRPTSREKRPGPIAPPLVGGSGRTGSPQSTLAVDDDSARTVAQQQQLPPPLGFASPLGHPVVSFPVVVSAPTQEAGSNKSVHNLSVSNGARRLSRTEDNPLLEMMETSAAASQGGYEIGGLAPWWSSTTVDATARNRTANAASFSKGTADRRTTVMSRDESGHFRSSTTRRGNFCPTRSQSGCLLSSRAGGYDSDEEDQDREVMMRERHRSRVDEVLRQLNATMRSNAGEERGGGNGAASGRNNSSALDATSGAAGASQIDANNTSGWAGIGGVEWGGALAAFGDGNAEGNTVTSASAATAGSQESGGTATGTGGSGGGGGGGGGWLGVGGGASSDDWYTRMRKKAQEEEAKAAAVSSEGGTMSDTPLPASSATAAPSRSNEEDDGNTTTTSSVATRAPTQSPVIQSTTTRRPSVQFVSRRSLTDRATPSRRPMTSAAAATVMRGSPPLIAPTSTAAVAIGATNSATPSPPSTVMVRQPTKPTTSPTAAAARERFARHAHSNARLQLNQIAADAAKTNGSAAAAEAASPPMSPSAKRAAMIAELESPESPRARTRFQPSTTSVPVHRASLMPDGGRAAPLPQQETPATYHRLSGLGSTIGGSVTDVSVSSAGGAGTTAPTPIHPPPGTRSSESFMLTPAIGGGTNSTGVPAFSYRQFDTRRRCSLPRVLPTVNTSLPTPNPCGPQMQGSNSNPANGRVRSGAQHSAVLSSISVTPLSSSPHKTNGDTSSVDAVLRAVDSSALDDPEEAFEAMPNAGVPRRPSAPAQART